MKNVTSFLIGLIAVSLIPSGCAVDKASSPVVSTSTRADDRHVSDSSTDTAKIQPSLPENAKIPSAWSPLPKRVVPSAVETKIIMHSYDEIVRSHLLTPAVAIISRPTIFVGVKDDAFRVMYGVGMFDSQNAFGAMLRGHYLIRWEHDGVSPVAYGDDCKVMYVDLDRRDTLGVEGSFRLAMMEQDIEDMQKPYLQSEYFDKLSAGGETKTVNPSAHRP